MSKGERRFKYGKQIEIPWEPSTRTYREGEGLEWTPEKYKRMDAKFRGRLITAIEDGLESMP